MLDAVLPAPLVILLLMAGVVGLGQLGLSPLIAVSVIGGLLPPAASLGLSPVVLAQTLLCAWGISVGSGYGGAVVHIAAALAGTDYRTLIYRWNGPFTLVAIVVLTLFLSGVNALLVR